MLEKFEILTGATDTPIDITTLKKYMRLPGTTEEDDILALLLTAARDDLEERLGRVFLTEEVRAVCVMEQPLTSTIRGVIDTETLPGVRLPRNPVQAVSSVALEVTPENFQALNEQDYAIQLSEPAQVTLYASAYAPVSYPWWLEYQVYPRLSITYTVGYLEKTAIPAWMTLLLLKTAAVYYSDREIGATPAALDDVVAAYRTPRV